MRTVLSRKTKPPPPEPCSSIGLIQVYPSLLLSNDGSPVRSSKPSSSNDLSSNPLGQPPTGGPSAAMANVALSADAATNKAMRLTRRIRKGFVGLWCVVVDCSPAMRSWEGRMQGDRCAGKQFTKAGRDRQRRQLYRCRACGRRRTGRSGSAFSGYRFPDDIIALAVRW